MNSNKFRSPGGKYYTRCLFYEEWNNLSNDEKVIQPTFTLYRDKEGYVNFGRAYIESRDPTGYKVTKELLGDYSLWTTLMNCRWFKAAKDVWDKEIDAAFASEAMEKIHNLLENGLPAQQLAAAKYLANREYRKDKSAGKGRPSNEQINMAAREAATIERELAEDFKRIQSVK